VTRILAAGLVTCPVFLDAERAGIGLTDTGCVKHSFAGSGMWASPTHTHLRQSRILTQSKDPG
jgi:hypothetical protein